MSEIGERVSRCIEALGVKRSAFAKAINVTPSHVTKMCAGETNLSDRTISDICKVYSVSEKWLRDGIGQMFEKQTMKGEVATLIERLSGEAPTGIKVNAIVSLMRLDNSKWEAIGDFLGQVFGLETE
jgi:transcriptional regulator with XRE-family HTH domain